MNTCSIVCVAIAFAGSLGCHHNRGDSKASAKPPGPRWENDGKGEHRSPNSLSQPQKSSRTPDQVSLAPSTPEPGERFSATPVGQALNKHLLILLDISKGADERKDRSLEELRKNAKEASAALLAAYKAADPEDLFGRWLLTHTLYELRSNEAYPGLREIAYSEVPADLKDSDLEGSALSNESAIRQSAVWGLTRLARAGNAAAEKDVLTLALKPPSKDDAVRTAAIKGYLAAGRDYESRVRTLKGQLPTEYHDVVTLTVPPAEEEEAPPLIARPRRGG